MREPQFFSFDELMSAELPTPDITLDRYSGPGIIDTSFCLPPGGPKRLFLFVLPLETVALYRQSMRGARFGAITLVCLAAKDSLSAADLDFIFDELEPDAHYVDFAVLTPDHRAAVRALNQHRGVDYQLAPGIFAACRRGIRN